MSTETVQLLNSTPKAETEHVEYLPLFQRTSEQLLNPSVQFGEALELAKRRKVVSVERRQQASIKIVDKIHYGDKLPKEYWLKVDPVNLKRELNKLEGVASESSTVDRYANLILREKTLFIEIGGSYWKMNSFRTGSMPLKLIKYLSTTKANELVSLSELRQNNIELKDGLSETFRSIGFNRLRKQYFLPTLEKSLVQLQTRTTVPPEKVQELVFDLESVNRI